jgi:glycosyltransferase involved in cell wall biosynthesis
MHGILNSPQIRSLMVTSRAFVQHSIRSTDGDSEGTPVGILEASAAGLPVISTLHAGIPDAVVNKLTGLLVEEGDVNGMGAHMADLLTQPARAHDLGIRAREHMLNRYSMPERIQTLIEAIERAFASGRGNISALKKVKMPATQESLESTTTISGATVWHRRTR